MKHRLAAFLAFLILAFSALVLFYGSAISGGEAASPSYFTACGCGCCADVEPQSQCLYHSNLDSIESVISKDVEMAKSQDCPLIGCSIPIRYSYCD
ncbi:MAG: hypothetical protein ABIF01_01580 [Candidatus Micrarchaeota archaeon]